METAEVAMRTFLLVVCALSGPVMIGIVIRRMFEVRRTNIATIWPAEMKYSVDLGYLMWRGEEDPGARFNYVNGSVEPDGRAPMSPVFASLAEERAAQDEIDREHEEMKSWRPPDLKVVR